MNILYLNTNKTDYAQDILYAGLRKNKNIRLFEFPFNYKYHFPLKAYPKNLGYAFGDFWKSFLGRIPWSKMDICVIAGCNPTLLRLYLSIEPKLSSNTRLVFVDGGDWEEIGGDFKRLEGEAIYEEFLKKRNFDLVFKREMLIDKAYPENTHPFPFGFNTQRLPKVLPKIKKYGVSFWAVESFPIRTKALQLLENKFDCAENGTVRNQQFSNYKRKGNFYLQELAACKIVLNFRGAGWDTLRYWETPATGTFLISQKPQIIIPNNFRAGQEIIYCKDDLSDLIDLCHYYLTHDEEREKIAQNSQMWLHKYHSETERANYFLSFLD